MCPTTPRKRIFSGMQPTNALTLGNYLGALKNWVTMQASNTYDDTLFCVVDLHAITVPYETDTLQSRVRELTASYIAAGIDTSKAIIFAQSDVPAHSQLMWLLATQTQMGKLDRMTQFKDKAGKNSERAGLGLYSYPVLMAADILLYHGTHVPVGEDQVQHVELARDIASTFNHKFGETFPLPEAVLTKDTMRIMSLRDGTKKMSKSDESDYSRINLTDDADTIAQKLKKAKTDPLPFPATLDDMNARPEAKNLITIYSALTNQPVDAILNEFGGQQFSGFKNKLTDVAVDHLGPITKKMRDLLASPDSIDKVLSDGAERARAMATPILADVQRKMGFKA
jgi:tryptophanyl-tRNA synthetase